MAKKTKSATAAAPAATAASKKKSAVDLPAFIASLNKKMDPSRLDKARKMLKAERFQLFVEVTGEHLVGVVKSQSNSDLVYSCRLGSDGSFSCCTQNLFPCGGLRGAPCKHLLVLIIGCVQAEKIDKASIEDWVHASRQKTPAIDKDLMSETFLRYKGAESGQVDWRPTETIPEDYYAL